MLYSNKPLNLLVIEDNEGDFLLFEAYLRQTKLNVQHLYHAQTLAHAADYQKNVDLVFLDLSLPDSEGIESFIKLNNQVPYLPVIVLSGREDEAIALGCIARGAQDYLLKNDLNERLLEKSVFYSIERKKNHEELRSLNQQYETIASITNELIWNLNLETNEIQTVKSSLYGYEDIRMPLNWWFDKIHPDDKDRIAVVIQLIVDRKLKHLQEEYRFCAADGSYRHLLARAVLLPGQDDIPGQVLGSMMDITEIRKLEDELSSTRAKMQQQLIEATILGQEREKEFIGKELHDNINQILASVKLYLDLAISNPDTNGDVLKGARKNVEGAIQEIRKLSHSLLPPSLGDHGLVDAIQELAEELNTAGKFYTIVESENVNEFLIENDRKLMLYRVVQEQINNIVKYSKASEVTIAIRMENDHELLLTLSDNGIGFDTSRKAKGIGLKNIESRVRFYSGQLEIHSEAGIGTSLRVRMPL